MSKFLDYSGLQYYHSKVEGELTEYKFSGAAKTALLNLLEKVAFIDGNGSTYLNALRALLFPDVSYIDAVFTQGGATIYETDDLASLKQYLAVTAYYADGTSSVVPSDSYVLSGTLSVGSSTITVTYAGKTDTFMVTVSQVPRETLFGVFSDGYTVAKNASGVTVGQTYRLNGTARATTHDPFKNRGYTFTVTDPTKYNIAVYDIPNDTKISPAYSGAIDGYAYMGGNKSISWKTTDSVNTAFAWLAIKKMDNTAFTAEELADGAAAVFTFTRSE